MRLLFKLSLALLFSSISVNGFALALNPSPAPHIWHTLSVGTGEWNARLQVINEADKAWFVLPDGTTKIDSLKITSNTPQQIGLFLDYAQKPDFDLAYTVTLVKNEKSHQANMTSKSCIFLVTATGPGKPDIIAHAYNGADCSWKVAERGEDFYAA